MGGFADLAQRLERDFGGIAADANDKAKEIASAILTDFVLVTPVDTSKAVSNWQVGIDARPGSVLDARVPGHHGSTRDASASQTLHEGLALIASKQPGQTIYISNLTPYIGDLDRGSSRQFAGDFLARARIIARKLLGG